jgi:hypothetical protein
VDLAGDSVCSAYCGVDYMAAVANWKQDQPVGKYFVFF